MTNQRSFFTRPRLWGLLCGLTLAVAQFFTGAGIAIYRRRLLPALILLWVLVPTLGLVQPAQAQSVTSGVVVTWGSNTYGQVTIPAGLSDVTAIAAGNYHSLALKSNGTVVVWGDTALVSSTCLLD